MKFYIGITDGKWFEYLKQLQPDEVNFWRPSARTAFRVIEPGAPFLFKLHKPNDFIVGGAFFSGYSRVPISTAWDAFGQKNGAATFEEFRSSIANYREKHGLQTIDPEVGCIVLSNPFFFDESDWIESPPDWAPNLVQGKSYEDTTEIGLSIWAEVSARLLGVQPQITKKAVRETRASQGPVLGNQYLRTARLGQGAFRLMTLENYDRRCCITGETTVPVLEAAHIQPVALEGGHSLQNGLLMRADMHILYDKGLIGIDADYRIRVSSQIREQYLNGKVYYAHEGEQLRSLPKSEALWPSRDLLKWRMEEMFFA